MALDFGGLLEFLFGLATLRGYQGSSRLDRLTFLPLVCLLTFVIKHLLALGSDLCPVAASAGKPMIWKDLPTSGL